MNFIISNKMGIFLEGKTGVPGETLIINNYYKLSLLVSGVSHILWLRKVNIFSLHSTPCYGVESEIKTGSHLVEGDCTTQLSLIWLFL